MSILYERLREMKIIKELYKKITFFKRTPAGFQKTWDALCIKALKCHIQLGAGADSLCSFHESVRCKCQATTEFFLECRCFGNDRPP